MRAFLTLVRRELAIYFISPSGYVLISAVLFLVGISFVQLVDGLMAEPTDIPITEGFYTTWYFWLVMLLASPLITMRSFAQEKASGTFETLMTTPISDLQVVLSKFAGALLFFCALWLPLGGIILIVRHYTDDQSVFHPGTLAGTYLGILMLGAFFMSLGTFTSSLTRSQIVASITSLAMGMLLFLMSYRSFVSPLDNDGFMEILRHVSIIDHMHDSVRGIIDTRHLVFYLSTTFLFLFLTFKVVESRRWK
ncbi:MAG TPA: ABC transporter permease subunit [Verrucomicrobiota bacterium]|nr:ABC transporter permease subunit [Verrucomicrobiota bacterium]